MKKAIVFRFICLLALIAAFGLNITAAQPKELLIWRYEGQCYGSGGRSWKTLRRCIGCENQI